LDREDIAADLRDCRIELGLAPAGDEDKCALSDKSLRGRQADARASTGNDRDLAFQ
jgi:hypothetical protein